MNRLNEYRTKRVFQNTPEPGPKIIEFKGEKPIFVIQKHQASHLHYDFRLELKGVLKSWAIPKGPSLNPAVKRLAIEVEDHPFDYRSFEGNIPKGNYGAGSVMIWDEGTYEIPNVRTKKEMEQVAEEGLNNGHLEIILHGEKLKGKFALIKTNLSETENAWLLIKVKDEYASKQEVTQFNRSVKTNRTMNEIRDEEDPFFERNQKKDRMPLKISFMLAYLVKEPFDRKGWIFEIKWDGYRAMSQIEHDRILVFSRNKQSFNERFPKIVEELKQLHVDSAILDGEIVLLDNKGISRFQLMQNYQRTQKGNLCYYVFDLLYLNGYDLRDYPLIKRKEILKQLITNSKVSLIHYCDHIEEKGISFYEEAKKMHLEGIMCKNGASPYLMIRSKNWLKVKIRMTQEVVIGGFTEPRRSRKNFGALLIGVYEKGNLIYVGHVGGGFSEKLLSEVYQYLEPLKQKKCPFKIPPQPNEKVTWVKPRGVCEVSFSEWTSEGIMRQPIFQGLRIDVDPKNVKREYFLIKD